MTNLTVNIVSQFSVYGVLKLSIDYLVPDYSRYAYQDSFPAQSGNKVFRCIYL